MPVKGILSTSCVIFSYPKLLSISVLTFIKWRLTPSYAAKDTIIWQKRPKTIVIVIIVRMTIFKSIHMIFYVNTSWACALFINNKQHVGRKRTLTDSEIKRNRSEVSSKWNKCRIYVGDQLDRCCTSEPYNKICFDIIHIHCNKQLFFILTVSQ